MSDSWETRALPGTSESTEDSAGFAGTQREQESVEIDRVEAREGELSEFEVSAPGAPPPLTRILEALLFVGGSSLTAEQAAAVVRGLTPAQFTQAIDALNRDYRHQGRPYRIEARDQGYVLVLRPRFKPLLDRLYGQTREARLSPAAIDVLSLVAYRQPVTKQEIDSIRGTDSSAPIRQLVRRGLIAIVRRGESGSREVGYGTTTRFLELFKLSSLDDLPQTQDLQKL